MTEIEVDGVRPDELRAGDLALWTVDRLVYGEVVKVELCDEDHPEGCRAVTYKRVTGEWVDHEAMRSLVQRAEVRPAEWIRRVADHQGDEMHEGADR